MSIENIEAIVDEFYASVDQEVEHLRTEIDRVRGELRAQGRAPSTELLEELWFLEEQLEHLYTF